jgi:hypothetical protein
VIIRNILGNNNKIESEVLRDQLQQLSNIYTITENWVIYVMVVYTHMMDIYLCINELIVYAYDQFGSFVTTRMNVHV